MLGDSPVQAMKQSYAVSEATAKRINTPLTPMVVYQDTGKVQYTVTDDSVAGLKYLSKAKSTGNNLDVKA